MKHTYLTVDLDYWYSHSITGTGLPFVQKLFALNRPMKVFTEHHLILRDIDRQYDKVINIDFHSDIVDRVCGWPNCGTWANYFPGRQDAIFEWRYPNKDKCIKAGWGLCHMDEGGNYNEDGNLRLRDGNRFDPFYHPEFWTWKNVARQQGLKDLDLSDVDRVSFILSPMWSEAYVIQDTLRLLSGTKGRKTEYHSNSVGTVINRMLREAND